MKKRNPEKENAYCAAKVIRSDDYFVVKLKQSPIAPDN